MFRPTGFPSLAGRRVGVWGLGVEGRATVRALRAVGVEPVMVDDQPGDGVIATSDGGLDALASCDIVLKSPGISRYRDDVRALGEQGVLVTSALEVWRSGTDTSHVIAVTGTKGKSTTASVIAFLLSSLGASAAVRGNIGLPPYDLDATPTDWTVLETSSFQAADLTDSPAYVVVTTLGEDHLDWHGSVERYHDDKLRLTRGATPHETFTTVDTPMGGTVHLCVDADEELATSLHLVGPHNARNVALAVSVVAHARNLSVASVRAAGLTHASAFSPLPGRLSIVSTDFDHRGITVVDDGLASNPTATVAALEAFQGRPITLLVGGLDRGVAYHTLIRYLHDHPEVHVEIFGELATRLAGDLTGTSTEHGPRPFAVAVHAACAQLAPQSVLLFSPGAPSFDEFENWQARSAAFREIIAAWA